MARRVLPRPRPRPWRHTRPGAEYCPQCGDCRCPAPQCAGEVPCPLHGPNQTHTATSINVYTLDPDGHIVARAMTVDEAETALRLHLILARPTTSRR